MMPKRQILLLAEAFSNAGNGFLTSIIILSMADQAIFAEFTILGTAVLAAKIIYQYLIVNQFNLTKFELTIDSKKLIYRFMIYTIICILFILITESLIIFFTLSKFHTALALFILFELIYIYLRAITLKKLSYISLLISSCAKTVVSILLFINLIDHNSSVEEIFTCLAISCFLSILILIKDFRYMRNSISISTVKKDFLDIGKYQLPTGAISWVKTSAPYFIINLLLGEDKLIVYRTLQIVYAPLALAFSIFESYLPQKLAMMKYMKDGKGLLLSHISRLVYFSPIMVFLYFFLILLLKSLTSIAAFQQISVLQILIYSLFVIMIPFNAVLQIGLRYLEQARTILLINVSEINIMIVSIFLISKYLGLNAVLAYFVIASCVINVIYFSKMRTS
jgi:hypothetical protein